MTTCAELDAAARDIIPDAAGDRLAEFDVVSFDELTKMPPEQRVAKLRSMANGIFSAAALGLFLMGTDRAAVVDLLVENPRRFDKARLELAKVMEEARCLLKVIDVADRRLAASLAVIANRSPLRRGAAEASKGGPGRDRDRRRYSATASAIP